MLFRTQQRGVRNPKASLSAICALPQICGSSLGPSAQPSGSRHLRWYDAGPFRRTRTHGLQYACRRNGFEPTRSDPRNRVRRIEKKGPKNLNKSKISQTVSRPHPLTCVRRRNSFKRPVRTDEMERDKLTSPEKRGIQKVSLTVSRSQIVPLSQNVSRLGSPSFLRNLVPHPNTGQGINNPAPLPTHTLQCPRRWWTIALENDQPARTRNSHAAHQVWNLHHAVSRPRQALGAML